MTFNKGGRWENLTLPDVDANGVPIACSDAYCLLHLHGPSSWVGGGSRPSFASFYSHSSAPGVIMGTGNIGQFLSFDPSHVNTYLSRDGGETWHEIMKGPFIYEYGDHGGLLVMAKYTSSGFTSEILYSLDLGICWEGPIRLAQPMAIDNIRVEPRGFSHTFFVHGRLQQPAYGKQAGAIATLNFKTLPFSPPIRDCAPTAADYEIWSPQHCLLGARAAAVPLCARLPGSLCALPHPPPFSYLLPAGAKVRMQRRKRDARCFNGLNFNRTVSSTPCDCAIVSDFECEFGTERPGPGQLCAPITGEGRCRLSARVCICPTLGDPRPFCPLLCRCC